MQLDTQKLGPYLNRYVPITAWLPAYPRQLLRPDIIAGVTVWGVMVPVAMAYAQMAGFISKLSLTNPYALAVGAGALAVIFLIKRFYPRIPRGLVAVVLGILAVAIFDLDQQGVSIVGMIPTYSLIIYYPDRLAIWTI